MERAEMETFLTLCEELHFGRTAERLHVTTGLVSRTVKRIERRIGAPLFERSSRRVALTAVGEGLRDDLRPLWDGIGRALRRAELAGSGVTGTLTVGFMGAQNGRVVHAARTVFEHRNPRGAVRVVETQLHQHAEQLRDGSADLLLTTLPVDEPDLTVGAVVTRGPRFLVLPAGHRLADRGTVTLEDLGGETFVDLPACVPGYFVDFHMPRQTPGGRAIARHGDPCGTYAEAVALVAAGRAMVPGDGQLPLLYRRPDLRFVRVGDAPPVEQGLVWRCRDDADPRVRAFADAVHEVAPALAPPGVASVDPDPAPATVGADPVAPVPAATPGRR
nr:LysR family transcriptional regulator [Kitasatospora purpeofusca]